MKQDRRDEHRLPDSERHRLGADGDDLEHAVAGRQNELARVEAKSRRRVHVPVDVVDAMEPPEEGRAVIEPVPDPERVVEQEERRRDPKRRGRGEPAEQAELVFQSPRGDRNDQGGLKNRERGEADAAECQVAGEANGLMLARLAKRTKSFGRRKQERFDRNRDGEPRGHHGEHTSPPDSGYGPA